MFITDEEIPNGIPCKGVKLGSLTGMGYAIPEDFNDTPNDLREYV